VSIAKLPAGRGVSKSTNHFQVYIEDVSPINAFIGSFILKLKQPPSTIINHDTDSDHDWNVFLRPNTAST
jgi:hypothetical protein